MTFRYDFIFEKYDFLDTKSELQISRMKEKYIFFKFDIFALHKRHVVRSHLNATRLKRHLICNASFLISRPKRCGKCAKKSQ